LLDLHNYAAMALMLHGQSHPTTEHEYIGIW
jgi:hypothetical protein